MSVQENGVAPPENAIEALADFAIGQAPTKAPQSTIENAKLFLADTLACALAGSSVDTNETMIQAFKEPQGNCSIPGRPDAVNRDSCAVMTAHAIHCLEWDAVHEPAVVHAMSVTTGALWAELQSHEHVGGRALLECIIVGVEIASRLGVATDGPLRFFRPATAGLMGAAAAIARLRGFGNTATMNALGLAYCQLQGTMQAHLEGTPALAVQVGLSARAALNACDMAAAGLVGPHDVLTGKFGYFELIEDGGDAARLLDGLGHRFAIDELSIKPYPSGRASHGVLSVLLHHIGTGKVTADTFAGLSARVPPLVHRLVGRPLASDMSTAYARLCLPFLVGLSLRDKMIDPREFTGHSFADPGIAAHAARVDIQIDDNQNFNALAPQQVEIALVNGEIISEAVPAVLGAPSNPLSEGALQRKLEQAVSMAQPQIMQFDAIGFFRDVRSIDQFDNCLAVFKPLIPTILNEQRNRS